MKPQVKLSCLGLLMLLGIGGVVLFLTPANAQYPGSGIANVSVAVTSGTPIRVSTSHIIVDRVSIFMQHGGTGIGYVCTSTTTPSASCGGTGQLAQELAPATSTAPGGQYTWEIQTPGLDLSTFWIDGSHTGDNVAVSYHIR